MVNSCVVRKDLDTEMTAVLNEMERGENSPSRILSQRTMALMFAWHNYGEPTIAARADIENVDLPRPQAFSRLHYLPDNAILIVRASRLYKRLTQTRMASEVSSHSFALHDPGAMFVSAQLAPGQDVDKARAELIGSVEPIRREPIGADELTRANLK